MSRRRKGEGGEGKERFADLLDAEVVPLARDETAPPPAGRRAPPARQPVRFVLEEEGSGRAEDVSRRALAELRRGRPAPERQLDLHGLGARAAARRVRELLEAAHAAGLRCVLVIHGRGQRSAGEPVLRRALPEWLAAPPLAPLVQAFAPAPERLGGAGATLVLLRRARKRVP